MMLCWLAVAAQPSLDELLAQRAVVQLRQEYHPLCRRPCELHGFSFGGPAEELRAMRDNGANIVGYGSMWVPVPDETAPNGAGAPPAAGYGRLAQLFRAVEPFDGFAPCLPTSRSDDSGCDWALRRSDRVVAQGTFGPVADNSWPEALFEPQPPGEYTFEIGAASGTWIGWWLRPGDLDPAGQAVLGVATRAGADFEYRLRVGGRWRDVVPGGEPHTAMHLGPSPLALAHRIGLDANYSIGNWNNPGFPYYPRWFVDRFPETIALDQNGRPIEAGMFEERLPAPGVDDAITWEGTRRHIAANVPALRDEPALRYWVLGGEALYATYSYPASWTDYSEPAIAHFRAWLGLRYREVAALNAAWSAGFASLDAVDPPRAPGDTPAWRDWLEFRFASMAERFGWHWQAAKEADGSRLIVSCNHGDFFAGDAYARLGARPELYAATTDGFETGQIVYDLDPTRFNLLYTQSIAPLGKPYCPARLAYKKSDERARGGGTSYTPVAARRYVYESLGADAWHLGLIQWSGSLPDGEWGVVGTPAEATIAELWRELEALAPYLDGMHAVRPRAALYLPHDVWAVQGFQPSWQSVFDAAVRHQVPLALLSDLGLRDGGYPVVVRVEAPEVKPEMVLADLDDACRPVRLTSPQTVRVPAEQNVLAEQPDLPQDLAGLASVGQTVRLEFDGLKRLAIGMPTWYRQPPVGFTFELRRDGPGGELLASREVPGGVSDNALVPLDVPAPPPAGTLVYVRVVPHAELPSQHLGWWSRREDSYADGTAWLDDQPSAGDRLVRLWFDRPVPATEALELALLSDGLNYGLVLINLAAEPVRLEADLSRLLHGPARLTEPLRGTELTLPTAQLELPANGTSFLCLERQLDPAPLLAAARARVAAWRAHGAVTEYAADALDRAERAAAPAKAAAFALGVCDSIGLAVGLDERPTADSEVTIRLYDAVGAPLEEAGVRLEVVPDPTASVHAAQRVGPGVWRARLGDLLPPRYDYEARRYRPFWGALRLRVHAESGGREAARLVDRAIDQPR